MRFTREDAIRRAFGLYYPGIPTIVGVRGKHRDNLMAAGWHMPVSFDPPMWAVAIGHARYTHTLLEEADAFTLNFVALEHAMRYMETGRVSGRETDKIRTFKIPVQDARSVRGVVMEEAYLVLECHLTGRMTAGDHDIVVGQVVEVHVTPDRMEGGNLPDDRWHPPVYLGGSRFAVWKDVEIRRFQLPDRD